MRLAAVALCALALAGCGGPAAPPKVKVKLAGTPPDATVVVDDQVVGPLRMVQKLGLSLAPGKHRVTVEREGYFPFDRVIESTGEPVTLDVALTKLPE
jgi:hypothetical protein